jgi:hypothetical protein
MVNMQILIQLHYLVNGGKLLQQGDFRVNERNYNLVKKLLRLLMNFIKK